MIKVACQICKKDFKTYNSRLKAGKGKFCSRKCSFFARKGRSAWNKGKKLPQITGKNHPMFGKHHSTESKIKISKSLKGQIPWNKNTKGLMNTWNKGLKLPQFSNEKNPQWKGNAVSYSGLHHWVKRHKGLPKFCEHCKTTEAKKFEWANVNHTYKRILSDFISLCTSCHRKFDITNNNYK